MIARSPVAAVAIACRCAAGRFALIRRGTPPDTGNWSLPGGKIELGEPTIAAAARELCEETGLCGSDVIFATKPFMVSDVIVPTPLTYDHLRDRVVAELPPTYRFHYTIAQTFAVTRGSIAAGDAPLRAGDDATSAQWFDWEGMERLRRDGTLDEEVVKVLRRAEFLHERGCLMPEVSEAPR